MHTHRSYFVILFVSLLFAATSKSQFQYQWGNSFPGVSSSSLWPEKMAAGENGRFVAAGSFSGTVDADPGSGVANITATHSFDNLFVATYSGSGNLNTVFSIGSSSQLQLGDVTFHASGDIMLSCQYTDSLDADPGPGVHMIPGGAYFKSFLARYSPAGDLRWLIPFDDGQNCMTGSVCCDASGNTFISGSFSRLLDLDPGPAQDTLRPTGPKAVFAASYDSSGQLLSYYRPEETILTFMYDGGLAPLPGGKTVFSMLVDGQADLLPGNGSSLTVNGMSIALVCLDQNGQVDWTKNWGPFSSGFAEAPLLAVSAMGDIGIAGILQGTVDFDTGPGTWMVNAVQGSDDIFLAVLDSTGQLISAGSIGSPGSDFVRGISSDASGVFFLTGLFDGSMNPDPNGGPAMLYSNGYNDVFLAGYSPAGNLLAAFSAGTGSNIEDALDVVCTASGIVFSGRIYGACDFDPGPGTQILGSPSSTYLVSFGLSTGIASPAPDDSGVQFFPNPMRESVMVRMAQPDFTTGQWHIRDASGRELRQGSFTGNAFVIDGEFLPAGIYFCSIRTASRKYDLRLVVAD